MVRTLVLIINEDQCATADPAGVDLIGQQMLGFYLVKEILVISLRALPHGKSSFCARRNRFNEPFHFGNNFAKP